MSSHFNTCGRRSALAGAVCGAAALGLAQTGVAGLLSSAASPAQAAESYTYADTIEWDAQYDVVVLGAGFSGMIAAMEAAGAGASVLLVDKCAEGQSGGNSRVCGQMFAYANGDKDAAVDYYRDLAGGRDVPSDMIELIAEGVADMADTISGKFGMNRDDFMDVSTVERLSTMSPEYPEKEGSSKIALYSTHDSVSDSYLFQAMRERLATYKDIIDVWYESPAERLIQEPEDKTVIGVEIERGGHGRNVRALNGVCVCTGGFECDKDMVQTYLNVVDYAPIGALYNTGDGIRMCQAAGARLWHMNAYEGGFGLGGLGYYTKEGEHARQIAVLDQNEMNTGATIVVGSEGRRYLNESVPVRHGHMPDGNGLWENPRYPMKSYVIWDKTQYEAITAAGILDSDFEDSVEACGSVHELADEIGCDEEILQQTLDAFNSFAATGTDLSCGRDADTMRAFDGESYYVMPVKSLLLNTQGGPERNTDAEVLNLDGDPIPHLYSAGEMGGFTACMYQGGTNVAECFITGQIAGANAAKSKDALPAYEVRTPVTSSPALLGADTDLA